MKTSYGLAAEAVRDDWLLESSLQLVVFSIIQLFLACAASSFDKVNIILISFSLITALNVLIIMKRSRAPLVNPISIFLFIWKIVIPLTSFRFPLMEQMSMDSWKTISIAGVTYGAGCAFAAVVVFVNDGRVKRQKQIQGTLKRGSLEKALLIFLSISIFVLLVNYAINGGIELFSASSEAGKTLGTFPGFSFLSQLGSISLVLIPVSEGMRHKKAVLALYASYILLQTLSGQRFAIIVSLLMMMTILATRYVDKREMRTLVGIFLLIIGIFIFVSYFRGGADDKTVYFINSGIYSGDVADLTSTELFRYFGMSQRNMEIVMSRQFEISNLLEYTLSPFTNLFTDAPESLGTSTYGYTANNIIAYMYHDLGIFWWVLCCAWGMIVAGCFRFYQRRTSSVFLKYIWAVAGLSVWLSFFAYINAYLYWVIIFPAIVYLMENVYMNSVFDGKRIYEKKLLGRRCWR